MAFGLPDEVADAGGGDQDLEGHDAAGLVGAFEERLRNDRPQSVGQRGADLRLLLGREDFDHASTVLTAPWCAGGKKPRWPVVAASTRAIWFPGRAFRPPE